MTIKGAISAVTAVITGWIALLAAITVLTDAAPASLVLFPGDDLLQNLSAGTGILSITPVSVTLASGDPDLALDLYRKGAWLVLPAGLRGCF